ncbi:MAG: (d)CMP kinase [Gammaproteobacteria bacterium]
MNNIIPVITIDGLASSGKSTVSKKLSKELGFYILDSGILYRTFAYLKTIGEIELFNHDNISKTIRNIYLEPNKNLSFNVLFKDTNITKYLHFEDIGHLASVVSKDELLRNSLLPLQHACIKKPGLIANGRDMGTKVFPNSMLKLYFIADIEIRAKRRYDQLVKNGSDSKLEDIRKSLEDRDKKDINRDISPLKAAKDAVIIDSTQLNVESILDKILELYKITET